MTDTLTLGQTAVQVPKEEPDDLILHSVTSVLKALDKPALIWWSADETARAAIRIAGTLKARIDEQGEEKVFQDLRRARFEANKDQLASAPLGTAFHSLAETYALTGQRPDGDEIASEIQRQGLTTTVGIEGESVVLNQMLDQFDGWLQRFSPAYQATEVCVFTPEYGVAGTCDGFFTIDGQRLIFDIKTSREQFNSQGKQKGPYPEVALQLAAYRHASMAAVWRPRRTEKWRTRYYLLSQEEQALAVPVPEVDAGVCLFVTPGSCEAHPIRCDQPIYDAFLYVLEAYRFVQDTAKTVVGPPLEATA